MSELWKFGMDEYAPAALDALTDDLLSRFVREGEPGDKLRALTYQTCRTCLVEVAQGEACDGCAHIPGHEKRAA